MVAGVIVFRIRNKHSNGRKKRDGEGKQRKGLDKTVEPYFFT
jgi:hypothetical protein